MLLPLVAGVLEDAAKDFDSHRTCRSSRFFNSNYQVHRPNILVSGPTLLSLASVFGAITARALDLLDRDRLFQYQTKNGLRRLTKVNGTTKYYTILDNLNYCQCEAFQYHVLKVRNALTCKHVLAVKLAAISGKIRVVETISDQRFKDVLYNSMPIAERN